MTKMNKHPRDPKAYARVTWHGYRSSLRGHWAYRLTRHVWRTLCGQHQVNCIPADDATPTCAICATRYAMICAMYDVDHKQDESKEEQGVN